jgi:hypothetical protein
MYLLLYILQLLRIVKLAIIRFKKIFVTFEAIFLADISQRYVYIFDGPARVKQG